MKLPTNLQYNHDNTSHELTKNAHANYQHDNSTSTIGEWIKNKSNLFHSHYCITNTLDPCQFPEL